MTRPRPRFSSPYCIEVERKPRWNRSIKDVLGAEHSIPGPGEAAQQAVSGVEHIYLGMRAPSVLWCGSLGQSVCSGVAHGPGRLRLLCVRLSRKAKNFICSCSSMRRTAVVSRHLYHSRSLRAAERIRLWRHSNSTDTNTHAHSTASRLVCLRQTEKKRKRTKNEEKKPQIIM